MLLVKSRELKSLGKSLLKTIGYSLPLFAVSTIGEAQSSASTSDLSTVLSISLSLFVVLSLIFGLAFIMRRFTGVSSGNSQMKVVASMMAGAKERIMVLQVGDQQHLIGVTANNINHLATLEEKLESATANANQDRGGCQQKLVEAMASRIQNKQGSSDEK